MSNESLLTITDLYRDFGGVRAVQGASFSVAQGTITGLIGPNGAGKSTVVAMIGGAIRPSAGSIKLGLQEIADWPPYRRARHGVTRTFQLSSEFGRLTVLENLLVAPPGQRGENLWWALTGPHWWWRQERALLDEARGLLKRFGMLHQQDEYAESLSGGQKRLLEIMRALMSRPKLLVLDEPMAGVNPTLAKEIEGHLLELHDGGLTMLLIEHEMGIVERLCNPVVVMARGKVISEGSFRDVRSRREVLDAYVIG
jgi:ABC-type branched-subunit amino acid transport system ATPase component